MPFMLLKRQWIRQLRLVGEGMLQIAAGGSTVVRGNAGSEGAKKRTATPIMLLKIQIDDISDAGEPIMFMKTHVLRYFNPLC